MPRSVYSETYTQFRIYLVEARNRAGLTQSDVAVRLGRTQSFISKYERGERRLDIAVFIDVAEALGISPVGLVQDLVDARAHGVPNDC